MPGFSKPAPPLLELAASRCGLGNHALELLIGKAPVGPNGAVSHDRVKLDADFAEPAEDLGDAVPAKNAVLQRVERKPDV